ncbi:hypothetical protein [Polyangium aurulentum]|uniref:hypothetical protein n=1 Tax=Polyangium aurulentum TaxID=2567896 RepID=UPI0010AE7A20|nr:hypothetical protein [Polyangium aurulentum]UQA62659.1 hypothetical protein E8A73_020270 [Polyangium aurulentum]
MQGMRFAFFYALAPLSALFLGCAELPDDLAPAPASDTAPAARASRVAVQPVVRECPADLPMDAYNINDARIDEDGRLSMLVQYGGGCREHEFTLCWDGGFMESYPVQTRLVLHHDGNGDMCRALPTVELRFDLRELEKGYKDAYGDDSGQIVLRLDGYDHTIPFSF